MPVEPPKRGIRPQSGSQITWYQALPFSGDPRLFVPHGQGIDTCVQLRPTLHVPRPELTPGRHDIPTKIHARSSDEIADQIVWATGAWSLMLSGPYSSDLGGWQRDVGQIKSPPPFTNGTGWMAAGASGHTHGESLASSAIEDYPPSVGGMLSLFSCPLLRHSGIIADRGALLFLCCSRFYHDSISMMPGRGVHPVDSTFSMTETRKERHPSSRLEYEQE
ncbi:hypothetical protein PDE_00982 [Penicillium oxalicum 114-2]|uniref:Uncharacterized protein n=2 Tax=Penicillium oxalicum TaxID=69781 RepID=S7ZBI1_PENO1|nr:hypothetical protein PDE_00982 [Penicillium oxalicum 114-2]